MVRDIAGHTGNDTPDRLRVDTDYMGILGIAINIIHIISANTDRQTDTSQAHAAIKRQPSSATIPAAGSRCAWVSPLAPSAISFGEKRRPSK